MLLNILGALLGIALIGGFVYRYIDLKKKGLDITYFWRFKATEPDPKKDALKELSETLKRGKL